MRNIDVVVVTYQSAAHLPECLASVGSDMDVVVVDNASTDGSADIAERLGARVVGNDDNTGFARAANQGAALGSGEFILFLNPDAAIAPDHVELLVDELRRRPEVALVGPQLVRPDGTPQRSWWPFPSARSTWLEALGADRLRSTSRDEPGFVVGACLLVRRTAFDQIGGFDERYWLYGEEADLAWRLHRRGWSAQVATDAVCRHVGGASGEGSERAFEEFQRGTERFIALHEGPRALVSHRIGLLVGSALRVIALTLVGRGSSVTAVHRRRITRRLVRVLLTGAATVPMAIPTVRHLVVFSLEAWDEVWRRNQFLVRELLALDPTLRVLFVEPPVDIVHHLLRSRSWPRLPGHRPCPDDDRVTLFTPRKVLPRVLGPWAERALLRQARQAMQREGATKATLWVNDPAYAGVTRWARPVLYDLTDDWTQADRPQRVKKRLVRWDQTLTRKAGAVVACSEELARTHSDRRDVVVVPNAVDIEHFTSPQPRPDDLPDGCCSVYVGTLHEDRLDVDLLADVARRLPEVAFVLVGPDALGPRSRSRLTAEPNVHLLGSRPYVSVPAYLQHAEVLIVPHVVDAFTDTLDPIKAYECQVMGRPVVATPVAGFRGTDWARMAASAEEFASAVSDAIGAAAMAPREVPTWQDRGREFAEALDSAEAMKPFVVYLDHVARLSGGELALARLLPALAVRPLVILGEDGPLVERLRGAGISMEVLPFASRGRDVRRAVLSTAQIPLGALLDTARYTFALSRRLRDLQPDLVHTNSLKSAYYGGLAAKLAGVPLVIHIRDRIADDYLPRPAVVLTRLLVRHLPDAVIVNSHTTLATLNLPAGTGSVAASPVVYDAVEQADVAPRVRDQSFTAVMVGRLSPWKGQEVFLRAFAKAFPNGEGRAKIVGSAMFGEDDFERDLKELVARLGIDDRVEFAGFCEDIGDVLRDASVLVHASIVPEPFGQVVLEGMAAGLPVIAARAGGPAEIIDDGVDGLLYCPADHKQLALLMCKLAGDPDLRVDLGAAARQRAADFRPSIVAAQMEAIYREVDRQRS